jgi:hypothetical protein
LAPIDVSCAKLVQYAELHKRFSPNKLAIQPVI